MGRPVWQAPSVLGCARASGAGLEAAATTAKRYNFVNTCNYLLPWRCACSVKVCSTTAAGRSAPARPPSGAAVRRAVRRLLRPRGRRVQRNHVREAARVPPGRAPLRGQGERVLPATTGRRLHGELDAAHQRLSSPPGWAPLRSRAGRGGQRVPSGRTAPRWGRGAGTAPPRPQRERHRRAPGRPLPDHHGPRT